MTTQVIAELDRLVNLLEAQIPANPNSPKSQQLANRLARSLARYFRALADAFPYDQVERLYLKYVKEQLGAETRDMLDPLLGTFDDTLTTQVNGHLTTIYTTGSAEMITWGKTKAGIPIAYEGPPISQAIGWAEKHGARLVTQMDAETKRRLAQLVSDGIKNKRGVPGLARDIRKDFANMDRYRSELIAKTETRQALFTASHDTMVDMGIEGKEWVLGAGGKTGNCELCQANAAVGIIPVGQEFPNPEGDIHPGCTCAIAPARLPAGAKPVSPAEDRVNEQVSDFADMTKTKDIEHASAFDNKGNVLFAKAGAKSHVTFSPAEVSKLRNAEVFIHNHPRSTAFSVDDVVFGGKINTKKLVVTSPRYTHTATPVGKTWDVTQITKAYAEEKARLLPQGIAIYKKSGQDAADMWMHHRIWSNLHDRAVIKYAREAS